MRIRLGVLLASFLAIHAVSAKEIKGLQIATERNLETAKLSLNGACIRKVKRFGIHFDVYIGALYLTAPSKDAQAIMASPEPKIIELTFLRSLEDSKLRDAWTESFEKTCGEPCKTLEAQIKVFNDLMVDVKSGNTLTMAFSNDAVDVSIIGKDNKRGKIEGQPFSAALMGIFLSDKTTLTELKACMLGNAP